MRWKPRSIEGSGGGVEEGRERGEKEAGYRVRGRAEPISG